MLAGPLEKALDAAQAAGGGKVIFLSPQGRKLDHEKVMELAGKQAVTLLCGRYEGVDERLIRRRVDEELSLGDFVLSGGELAAMAVIDAVVRQLPGALGDGQSAAEESFAGGLLDCPQYTRPEVRGRGHTGGAVCRGTTSDPALAPEAGAGQDLAEKAGADRRAAVERRGTETA